MEYTTGNFSLSLWLLVVCYSAFLWIFWFVGGHIFRRSLTESGTKLWFRNLSLLRSIFPSVAISMISFLVILLQLEVSHCLCKKYINSDVAQALSPILFVNDFLSVTLINIHSYVEISFLITPFDLKDNPFNLKLLFRGGWSWGKLSSNLSLISSWGKENMVIFNATKTVPLHIYSKKKSLKLNIYKHTTWTFFCSY